MKHRCPLLMLMLAIAWAAAPVASAQLWKGEAGDIAALEKAAAAGDPDKTAEFAWHLVEGQGSRRFDAKQIFKLFESAAAKGSVLGQVGLSRCYAKGIGTKADLLKAWKLAEQAGKTDHPEGWKQMGYLLTKGYGVAQDRKQGMEYTAKAAAAGSIAAQVNHMIDTGYRGYPDRYSPGAELAIRTGHLLAAYNAAFGYVFNRGEPEEYERNRKLIALLEDRAKLEHPDALRSLAFVRSCQGDMEAKHSLMVRAALTGVQDGMQDLAKDLNFAEDAKAGRVVAPFYVSRSDRHAMNFYFYLLGDRSEFGVNAAARALEEGYEGKEPDPAAGAKLLAKHLPGEKKHLHFYLANRYRAQMGKDSTGKMGKLAMAHAAYACDEDPRAAGLLAFLFSGQSGLPADLPRAEAAMRKTPESDPYKRANAKKLADGLSAEQETAADALEEKGYPTAPEFVQAAAAILKEAGELEGTHE